MKILNHTIKVMSIFHPDGKIQPTRFRLDEEAVIVEKIIKSYEEKLVGNKRAIFVCLHNEKDMYELKVISKICICIIFCTVKIKNNILGFIF